MMRFFLAFWISGLAVAAQAQSADKWEVYRGTAEEPSTGAMICPTFDLANRQMYCFAMGCDPDSTMEVLLGMTQTDYPEAFELLFEVDGREAGRMQFKRRASDNIREYLGAFDRAVHPALIAKMKRGNKGVITVVGSDPVLRQAITLAKSSKVLNVMLTECKLPTE